MLAFNRPFANIVNPSANDKKSHEGVERYSKQQNYQW
ncbi:hypothetical protein CLU88_3560 [Acidovorax sp. 56]|nr:hypothetical protein CLU88_3560 [Acidovorax sp. 56]